MSRAGLKTLIAPQPIIVAEHAFTTGIIPLATYRRATIPTAMRPGVGCAAADLSPVKRDAAQLPDDAEHELATCYAVSYPISVAPTPEHARMLKSRIETIRGDFVPLVG